MNTMLILAGICLDIACLGLLIALVVKKCKNKTEEEK